MLPPDELGEKGESRFREICADAQLICNQSIRDRAGWDFIVEFPIVESHGNLSLEKRAPPLSCYIQVKTISRKQASARLRLSVAERLAKELKPVFVYVLSADKDLNFSGAHLLHIIDENLSYVLRRLRQEQAAGKTKKINRRWISFGPRNKWLHLPVTGPALKEAIESACTGTVHDYVLRKREQIQKLGFEPNAYTGSFRLKTKKPGELVDIFLGLKKDVPVASFKAYETRFGIQLPIVEFTGAGGQISIEPHGVDCSIQIRKGSLDAPISIPAKLFIPAIPGLPAKFIKALCKSDLFSLTIGNGELGFKTEDTASSAQPPKSWISFWSLLRCFVSGEGTLSIAISPSRASPPIPLETKMDGAGLPSIQQCEYWIDACTQISSLLERAGIIAMPRINLQCVHKNIDKIRFVNLLADKPESVLSFTLTLDRDVTHNAPQIPNGHRMVYIDFLDFEDIILGYYGITTVDVANHENAQKWKFTNVELRRLGVISRSRTGVEAFIEEAQKDTGIRDAVWQAPDGISPAGS